VQIGTWSDSDGLQVTQEDRARKTKDGSANTTYIITTIIVSQSINRLIVLTQSFLIISLAFS